MADYHDVYPNAPLTLVALEIRFLSAATGRPLSMAVQRSFRDVLGDGWVIGRSRSQQVSVVLSPAGAVPQVLPPVSISSFTVRDRTLGVAVTEDSVTIETTMYRHYQDFRKTVERAVMAAADLLTPDGVARIGMRYIDEIRVPGINAEDPSEWQEWVDASLLAPQLNGTTRAGFKAAAWEGVAQYETGPNQKVVLRYGPRMGYVVNPAGPLNRPRLPSPGPLFALDFDCFWEPPDIPEFNAETVMLTCDQLHAPIRALFDILTTEKLLAEFKKETPSG